MSTSLMYHGFGLRGYCYRRTTYDGGQIHLTVEHPDDKLQCAACGSRRVIRKGGRKRCFRGLPIGDRAVWIELRVPRLGCKDCGRVRQAEIPFAPGQHRYTKRFARYVLELARRMTMWDVAQHLGVSWNLVKSIVKADLERRFGKPRLRDLTWIAIDEISIEGGHRYLTVVLDLESGSVVFVGEGKGAGPWIRSGSGCAAPGPGSKAWRPTCPGPTSTPSKTTCPTTSRWLDRAGSGHRHQGAGADGQHAADSGGFRPPIPIDSGHRFQSIPATGSEGFRPAIPADSGHPRFGGSGR